MARALLLSDQSGDDARLRQVARIYRGLGLSIDQLALRSGPVAPALRSEAMRIGRIDPAGPEGRGAAAAFVQSFLDGWDYRLLHADGAEAGALLRPGGDVLRVLDIAAPAGEVAPPADLILHRGDAAVMRQETPRSGAFALPPCWPEIRGPMLARRRTVGWVGDWNQPLVQAWDELLRALSASLTDACCDILLAGPGVDAVHVPRSLTGVLKVAEPDRMAGARRALGLGVLPLAEASGRAAEITAHLARGTPILTLRDAVAAFGADWQLPVHDSGERLAEQIAALIAPLARRGIPAPLRAASQRTAAAFRERLDAATARYRDEIALRLGLAAVTPG